MSNKYNEDFESILTDPALNLDITADEMAMRNSGLIHPEELELERILAEDWDSVPDQDIPKMTLDEALNQFLYGDQDDAVTIQEEPTQEIAAPAEEELVEEILPPTPGSEVVYLDTEAEDVAEEAASPDELTKAIYQFIDENPLW